MSVFDYLFTSFSMQENLTGLIVVDCKNDSKHDGIFLSVEATVNMQLSSKNVGLFEAFYNSARVRNLLISSLF